MTYLAPGAVRALARILSEDGYVLGCAIDHLGVFNKLLGAAGDSKHADIVRAKDFVVSSVSDLISVALLDPDAGVGPLVMNGTVRPAQGLMVSIENEDYGSPTHPRGTIMRDGWTPSEAKKAGADVLKLLWFYRPDLDEAVAEEQRKSLKELHRTCRELALPLLVEPIWYPVDGEDPTSEEWQKQRVEGILRSVVDAEVAGMELLKSEFPGSVTTPEARREAAQACERITRSIDVPWVLLSSGATFDDFCTQLEIAAKAGASGYLAGRSVWADVVGTPTGRDPKGSAQLLRKRFERLNEIMRQHGNSIVTARPLDQILQELPASWYTKPSIG